MTSTQSSDEILKTDSLARVRTSPHRRQELLEEFERSGLGGAKFAALVGVKYLTFAQWLSNRRRLGSAWAASAQSAKVRWVEAVVEQAQGAEGKASGVLRVYLGSGTHADITHTQQAELAAALVRALQKPLPGC